VAPLAVLMLASDWAVLHPHLAARLGITPASYYLITYTAFQASCFH
jgi:hypothetical protein